MTTVSRARTALRRYALTFPGAWEDHPWGEDVIKVGTKVFVFFGRPDVTFGIGVKLPRSLLYARSRPFAVPAGYGMDRSGWVGALFQPEDDVPIDLMREWIAESYEAVSPGAGRRRAQPRIRKTKARTGKTTRPARPKRAL